MYTLYKFHFLNGFSAMIQLFDDILIIWPAPVYTVGTESIQTPLNFSLFVILLFLCYFFVFDP